MNMTSFWNYCIELSQKGPCYDCSGWIAVEKLRRCL